MGNNRNQIAFHAWFAGFFDGEGTIGKRKTGAELKIAQALKSERNVMETFIMIQKTYGGKLTYPKTYSINHSQCILWRLGKRVEIKKLINNILPFIKLRKKDLKGVLDFYRNRPTREVFVNTNILYSDKSQKQISLELGCSQKTVCKMLKKGRKYYVQKDYL